MCDATTRGRSLLHRRPGAFAWALLLAFGPFTATVRPEAGGRTYHVDAVMGDDDHDGMAPDRAWRSIGRVNRAVEIEPGDRVSFRRGSVFRGSLQPQSGVKGRPVVYGAYGDESEPRPRLLGSSDRNRPDDWTEIRPGIWATQPMAYKALPDPLDLSRASWSLHAEEGAKVRFETATDLGPNGDLRGVRLHCDSSGSAAHHVQLSTVGIAAKRGRDDSLVFLARAKPAVAPASIRLMRASSPWTSYASSRPGDGETLKFGPDWSEHAVLLHGESDDPAARLTFFLGGVLPEGATLELAAMRLDQVLCNQAEPLSVDVGNIIFDGGRRTGVKKWSLDALSDPGDYYYDPTSWRVFLRSNASPAVDSRSIELALKRHIINESGVRFVRYENLDLRYGAAHGIGGGGVEGITVSDCDLSYIGGAHHQTRPDGHPVRYGNAVEFWSDARDCLVERCRIWEIYDAALTNQGSGVNVQRNIVYRNNVIWNSEYSFELWDRDETSVMENIRFEFNTCLDAGYGWAHGQRPDPNGRHVMLYDNSARTKGVVIRGNIFSRARNSLLRLHGRDWTKNLALDANVWDQPADVAAGAILLWQERTLAGAEAESLLHDRGFDLHSVFAAPRFVDRDGLDFRLAPDSPGLGLVDGRDAGASPDVPRRRRK